MEIVGQNKEGNLIVNGVFSIYETNGIPLDILFEQLRLNNYIPDWFQFVIDAVNSGMDKDRVISMLDAAISDSYGAKFRDNVLKWL